MVGGYENPALATDLCGIALKTPLLPAAGTLSPEALDAETVAAYGALLPKTVTLRARAGNPPPRIAETPAGMVNSIGLQNPGIDRFLKDLRAYETGRPLGRPLIVSVAGASVEEFAELSGRLAMEERVAAVEVNLSCPNVERGGRTFCASTGNVAGVVEACRARCQHKPILAKLTYEGAVGNAAAAAEAGADAVTLINTVPALTVDPRRRSVLVRGGLSGPAIKPLALRVVYEVSREVGVPVVGCGGVASGTDVAEFLLAGACAVEVGASTFVREPAEILEELSGYLRETESSVQEIIGLAVDSTIPGPVERDVDGILRSRC